MRVYKIKLSFALAVLIVLVYIIFLFWSGNYMYERVQGTWRAACIQDEIIFVERTFVRGRESGNFRVRANVIYFGTDEIGYPIRITSQFIVINGIYYLRVENRY